jgi:glycosyltransferase involved in cell wall biosynthesis
MLRCNILRWLVTVKHIVLITSGQPATNPRLIKEADCLSAEGFKVTVLYSYWNEWASSMDRVLLKTTAWDSILVGGTPASKRLCYFRSKVVLMMSRMLMRIVPVFADYALSRATYPLIKAAKRIKADIYIAHNLAALPAAVIAAKKNNGKSGFDAEDYHRMETTNDTRHYDYKHKKFIEDYYIHQLDHFTTSSPSIKSLYDTHYNKQLTVIKNVFPRYKRLSPFYDVPEHQVVKFCWFSQTIGPNRGLENLVLALTRINLQRYELHLLGELKPGFQEKLKSLVTNSFSRVFIHAPISPNDLFRFLEKFDVGIASEPAFCTNNDSAWSNKVFSYIQCGLALLISDTCAQTKLSKIYPGIGLLYKKESPEDLAMVIQYYINNNNQLLATKESNYQLGQHILNWEQESKVFLQLIYGIK